MRGIRAVVLAVGLTASVGVAAEPPEPSVDPVGMSDPEDASLQRIQGRMDAHDRDGILLACAAYRKDFPNGRKWLTVAVAEFEVSLRSPDTMDRATDLHREITRTRPDLAEEVGPMLKARLGLAFAKYGMTESAKRLLSEAAADPEFASDEESADFFRRQLADLDAIGKPFLGFRALDRDKNVVDTSLLVGKLVLVEFWTSWCDPCREELADVVKLYEEGKERGLVVIGVNMGNSPEGLEEFLEKNGITWPNVPDRALDGTRISDTLGVRSFPETILIDRRGAVIRRGLHGDDLLAEMRRQL